MRNWLAVCGGLLGSVALSGCDLGLDPDSLVRDLRVLAVRSGDDAAGSAADVDLATGALRLRALVAEPTGAGRKVAAPRALTHDWYLCLPGRSALATGSVDPECVRFGPADPEPRQNAALLYLGSGSPVDVNLRDLQAAILSRVGPLLMEATGAGAGTPPPAIQLQLPLVLRAQAAPATPDRRDAETAVTFVRAVFPLPGKEKDPLPEGAVNHNPTLQPLVLAEDEQGTGALALVPCQPAAPCQRARISRQRKVFLKGSAVLPASVERYLPLDQSGRGVQPEALRYSWFSSDGKFSELRTGDAKPWTQWTNEEPYQVPQGVRVVSLWLVVQDGRNGSDSAAYELELVD